MRDLFINTKLNQRFYEQGFVTIPIFSQKELDEIRDYYYSIKQEHNTTDSFFHTTLNTSNQALIEKVNGFLRPRLAEKLKDHLIDCDLTIAGFLVKENGKETRVNLHQDWNYVDESRFAAFNIWLALDETNKNNGCMRFIPNSHRYVQTLRVSPDIPGFFEDFKDQLEPYLVDVPTKPGECVFFHQAILHASYSNTSGKARIACISAAYPKEARLLHHFIPNKEDYSNIEVYEINLESMIHLKKDSRPSPATLLRQISYTAPQVDLKQFESYLKTNNSFLQNVFIGFKQLFNT